MKQKHYYILPDGSKAKNMKEAIQILKITKHVFKVLRKNNLVKKVNY